jgi:hypothetical protein
MAGMAEILACRLDLSTLPVEQVAGANLELRRPSISFIFVG